MAPLLTIGDFSRMTHLSIKTLRRYHELGLLEPAEIDPLTGYRLYRPDQIPGAQVIRRLRDLSMPLEEIRGVLTARDREARSEIVAGHLRRMERQLEATQTAVASLRVLLEQDPQRVPVQYRTAAAMRALTVRGHVAMDDAEDWWQEAIGRLHHALRSSATAAVERTGPDGMFYSSEFFTEGAGEVIGFVPVRGDTPPAGPLEVVDFPSAELAVTVHQGPFGDLDRAYGALGTYVHEQAIGLAGPIRENYLVTSEDTDDETQHRTEVCWPVFLTTAGPVGT